jgi:hypothetical protein
MKRSDMAKTYTEDDVLCAWMVGNLHGGASKVRWRVGGKAAVLASVREFKDQMNEKSSLKKRKGQFRIDWKTLGTEGSK